MTVYTKGLEDAFLDCTVDDSHLSAVRLLYIVYDGDPGKWDRMWDLKCVVCGVEATRQSGYESFVRNHAPCCPHCNTRISDGGFRLLTRSSYQGDYFLKCSLDGSHLSAISVGSHVSVDSDPPFSSWFLNCEVCDSRECVTSDLWDGYVEAHSRCCTRCSGPDSLNMLGSYGIRLMPAETVGQRFHRDTSCAPCRTPADQRFEDHTDRHYGFS